MSNGYNPMHYDCEHQGCFNKMRRPKIEVFADCFPGRISFGDIDAIVEICGKGLLLEWKSYADALPMGQRIMYTRLTKGRLMSVVCVHGDAETMTVYNIAFVFDGKWQDWQESNLDHLKETIKSWVAWAQMEGRSKAA